MNPSELYKKQQEELDLINEKIKGITLESLDSTFEKVQCLKDEKPELYDDLMKVFAYLEYLDMKNNLNRIAGYL